MSDQIPVNVNETYGPRSGSTPTSDYTPTSDDFLIDIDVDFVTRPITPVIHLVQYDYILPVLAFHLYSNRNGRPLPSGCVASIRINNGNGTVYVANADGVSDDRMTVYFKITSDLCISSGFKPGVIELSNAQGLINSSPFSVEVEQNPVSNDIVEQDESYISLTTLLDQVEKWREEGSTHLTNNSYIVTGKKSATDVANNATAEGSDNSSLAIRGHAEGYNNTISSTATSSHAEGSGNTVSGVSSHVEGDANTANGAKSHAEGYHTTASSATAHSEGNTTTASGESSHSEGNGTTASGDYSHAEGYSCEATGDNSHSEGYSTESEGASSHAEGTGSTASGASSHAEGTGTKASGSAAHAEGGGNTASGNYSHAEGGGNTASGNYSHASGYNTIAGYESQFVCGKYNENDQDNIFEIGNGEDAESRSNAFSVSRSGVVTMGNITSTAIANAISALGTQVYSPRTAISEARRGQYGGVVTLRPTANIPKGESGTFTGTYTVNISTAEWADFKGNKISRDSGNKPLYHPLFVTTKIQNEETLTNRRILEVGTTFSIGELNADQTSFEVTVTTNVINFSDTTAVDAANVIIEKEIWCLMSGYYDE